MSNFNYSNGNAVGRANPPYPLEPYEYSDDAPAVPIGWQGNSGEQQHWQQQEQQQVQPNAYTPMNVASPYVQQQQMISVQPTAPTYATYDGRPLIQQDTEYVYNTNDSCCCCHVIVRFRWYFTCLRGILFRMRCKHSL